MLSVVKPKTFIGAAWIVALVATAGSLYFSEGLGYTPCKLCWIQRIFMYPLVFLIGIAYLRRERGLYQYVLPLAVPGGMTSLYHYLKQHLAFLQTNTCGPDSCTTDYIHWLGFITIPFLALTAFVLIMILMVLLYRLENQAPQTPRRSGPQISL